MSNATPCPHCGQRVPIDAPPGICPACVLRLGMETSAADSGIQRRAPEPAALAASFPQFEVLELIGQGGMGAVYKARQRSLDRFVALKILTLDTAGDPAFEERFVRESRTLAQLTHPNIVTVFDSGRAGGWFYLVMEYVDGVNLREAIRRGLLGPGESLAVVRQVCDALQHAHDAGVVHRDIKPENILLDGGGRVRIADFGIARLVGRTPIDISLTATHQVLGTFRYMAPEQIEQPMSVDHRADIYALGVVLYELLTGELPLGRFALPSERNAASAGLDRVVLRALERDPSRRYQHASELKTDVTTASTPAGASGGEPPAADTAPVLSVAFTASHLFIYKSTSSGVLELYEDRVSFDFDLVSMYGPRSHHLVTVPLTQVRSVKYLALSGIIQLRVEPGPWTAQPPFAAGGKISIRVRPTPQGKRVVAAVRERLGR